MGNTKEQKRKLQRVRKGAIIVGVSTGLAQYFGVDVILVRIIFVTLSLIGGGGLLLYVLLWLFLPYDTKGSKTSLLKVILYLVLGIVGLIVLVSLWQSLFG